MLSFPLYNEYLTKFSGPDGCYKLPLVVYYKHWAPIVNIFIGVDGSITVFIYFFNVFSTPKQFTHVFITMRKLFYLYFLI